MRSANTQKLIIVCLIWLTAAAVSAFSVKEWKDSIFNQVKTEAEKGLSDLFQRKVKIGSSSGLLVGTVDLNDVFVPGVGRIAKVTIDFNPMKFAYTRGDLISSLTKIIVTQGDVTVVRSKDNRWNVLSLFPQPQPGSPPGPVFIGRVILKNCRAAYLDQIGFGPKPAEFRGKVTDINGEIDLRKKDKLKLSLSARLPETAKVRGAFDFKTGKYELNISAEQLDLERWVNYGLVAPDFKATGGNTDLTLKISQAKTKGWPVSINGKANIKQGALRFQSYDLNHINGTLSINDDGIAFNDLAGELNHSAFTVNGRFGDFSQQLLDLDLSIPSVNLKEARTLLPQTGGLELSGTGSARVKISGPLSNLEISGSAKIAHGAIFRQSFSSDGTFLLKNQQLSAEVASSDLYRGNSQIRLALDLSRKTPNLYLTTKFSKFNLFTLAQNSPGIGGLADGTIELSGPVDNLAGKVRASLNQARVFGQGVEKLFSSFTVREGDFILENLNINSPSASFIAYGKIGRDLSFDLISEAKGMRLSGRGIFGKMEVTVNHFNGDMHWKLDQIFLAAPLKHILASGEAVLSEGQIGEQLFDQAEGKIRIGFGKIEVSDTFLKRKNSILRVAGQTGIGVPTNLKLSGEGVDLQDLKILNQLLPAEYQDPTGSLTFEAEITGTLSKETQITSLDPLLGLSASGKININNGSLGRIPLTRAAISFDWQDHALKLPHCSLILSDSSIELNFESKKDGSVSASLKGVADLGNFGSLTKNYGKITGMLGLNASVSGNMANPVITASFWLNPLRFNSLYLNSITGSFDFRNQRLTLIDPLLLQDGKDLYSISGNLVLSPESQVDSTLDLELKILQADLSGSYELIENLRGEITRRFAMDSQGSQKINLSSLRLPHPPRRSGIKLYSSNGDKKYFLKHWIAAAQQSDKGPAAAKERLGGELSGSLQLKGKVSSLSGKCNLKLNKGFFRSFDFDQLTVAADLKNQEIKISQALLTKDRGSLSLRGNYNLKNQLFLNLVANNLPLDIMKVVFPSKEFKGNFNMNAGVDGPLQNLRVSVSAAGSSVNIAGVNFDKATFSFAKKGDSLYLHELSLLQGNALSSAYGSVDLSPSGQTSLEVNLQGDAIGLLNLFTDDVKWIRGSSLIKAKVQGTIDNPKINGRITVDNGTIQVRALDSEIRNLQADAAIKDNLLSIKGLSGIWTGGKTRNWSNSIGLAGNIDLSQAFLKKGTVGFDLSSSPTRLYIDFPNLYTGILTVKELSLKGPLALDFSQGPLLKGRLEVNNAVITLPQGTQSGQPAANIAPINFDLAADLTKNVYVIMGDVSTLNLSNIFMNLEISGQGLKVGGSLKTAQLLGKISVKRGTVNIFNREFTLLSTDNQKKFYPYDTEKIRENQAVFTGEQGPSGVLPSIDITSSVNVENQEKDASGQYVKKSVVILARLEGIPGAIEKDRGLNISLSSFSEDKTKSPSEMVPASYSEQDLKVMLLPDFIKSLAGIGQPGEASKVDTNSVVADYVSSRVQTILFRSLERQAEQSLGLESLTLEYNFGPKVREAMGLKDSKGFEEEKPAWSVGFVKGFFDRLYVDVRYSQGAQQPMTGTSATSTSFNYQLTYKLSSIWSIIYYREPISLTDITTGYQKVTVKAGFALW